MTKNLPKKLVGDNLKNLENNKLSKMYLSIINCNWKFIF